MAEVRRGLFPGGGTTVHLPRHISYCHAMEMLLTGDFIDARRAYDFGIVNRVVPPEANPFSAYEPFPGTELVTSARKAKVEVRPQQVSGPVPICVPVIGLPAKFP